MKAFNVRIVQLCLSPFMSLINASDWKALLLKRLTLRTTAARIVHPDITGFLDSIKCVIRLVC